MKQFCVFSTAAIIMMIVVILRNCKSAPKLQKCWELVFYYVSAGWRFFGLLCAWVFLKIVSQHHDIFCITSWDRPCNFHFLRHSRLKKYKDFLVFGELVWIVYNVPCHFFEENHHFWKVWVPNFFFVTCAEWGMLAYLYEFLKMPFSIKNNDTFKWPCSYY